MLGVRRWRHGAFRVSRQHRLCRRWPRCIFMYYSWKDVVLIHRLCNNVYHWWITNNIPSKWHRTVSTASAYKSSPRKIFHWNSSGERRLKFIGERIEEDNREENREHRFSTAKVTSSTQRPQTCTEAATKYYNYIVNETDEEREHRLPTLTKAAGLKCTSQVTGQVTGYRPQVRSQATGHRPKVRSQVTQKTIGHWTKLFWTDVLLYKNKISQGTLMSFKQY